MQYQLVQYPDTRMPLIRYTGDVLEIRLEATASEGRAFVRTNYATLRKRRRAVISEVEEGGRSFESVWEEIEMKGQGDGRFSAVFPLLEVGHFEFKAYHLSADGTVTWPLGDNLRVKVEPAFTVSENTIYNAFIRQFGRNIAFNQENADQRNAENYLTQNGYIVIPPTGKLAEFRQKLPHILDQMGFGIVLFLPIHPIPSVYGRMGHYGSPFAPLDFYGVEASLANFDRMHTPVQEFCELLDAIHAREAKAFIDIPLDHTGWASVMQTRHPEWFRHDGNGAFESPGAWGVLWEDLCKLDFRHHALWKELADILLYWCRLGVDGFRCDAGYMVPKESWNYITAKVRDQYPDTIFLLEGLGGSVETTCSLLKEGMMNWAYSESFQQFGLEAESSYLDHALGISQTCGTLVNFAETHDNNRLATTSSLWSVARTAAAALLAPAGAFGIANGVEWLATEKIDVHGAASLNWGAKENIVEHIANLNVLLKHHPAFSAKASLRRPETLQGNAYGLLRCHSEEELLVLVNPSQDAVAQVSWEAQEFSPGDKPYDLFTNHRLSFFSNQGRYVGEIPPLTVVCISGKPIQVFKERRVTERERQLARSFLLRLLSFTGSDNPLQYSQLEELVELLLADRQALFKRVFRDYIPVMTWLPERDCKRDVMVPPSHILLIAADAPFIADLRTEEKNLERVFSARGYDGKHFALLFSAHRKEQGREAIQKHLLLHCKILGDNSAASKEFWGRVIPLKDCACKSVSLNVSATNILPRHCGLCTNLLGSYTIARAAWGTLQSKYDALLAANPNHAFPQNQLVLLSKCHAWLRYRDYSCELNSEIQDSFLASYDNLLQWSFRLSFSSMLKARLIVQWELSRDENSGTLSFFLEDIELMEKRSGDLKEGVTLVVRPEIDWRSNHSVTKAYLGAEHRWSHSVSSSANGFQFAPDDSGEHLTMRATEGAFVFSPEWSYQTPLPIEQERGLEQATDLFSPGYFQSSITTDSPVRFGVSFGQMEADSIAFSQLRAKEMLVKSLPLEDALFKSLGHFVVRRDSHKSIIAGYPWFLDWGRDTLICLRGLIAAGMLEEAKDTILQFAQFAEHGTLPNMIRGNDTSDRQTSDAPLWLFVAVRELVQQSPEGNKLLFVKIGNQTLLEILNGILEDIYNANTDNGVMADKESGLIFSPAHYTWMDTNYPAGTPRSGYPVEIQSLWLHAIRFISEQGTAYSHWRSVLEIARESFGRFFVRGAGQGLCDCLHCTPFKPASEAVGDDACRPNQLLAITLGAVTEKSLMQSILDATLPLLTPGGIRSLDDARVCFPQAILDNGIHLNDPYLPYQGHYTGPEDSQRKPAYHNGTSWAWQMPLFSEAEFICHGESAREAALARLASVASEMERGCIGFLPEIYDGDSPHTPKGCVAQAWSMTEAYRVWRLLQDSHP